MEEAKRELDYWLGIFSESLSGDEWNTVPNSAINVNCARRAAAESNSQKKLTNDTYKTCLSIKLPLCEEKSRNVV